MNHHLVLNESIASGLDLIGDRWTLLILREAFYGSCRFDEFRRRLSISRATLTRRLTALVANEILYRAPYGDSESRFEYRFTSRGIALMSASLLAVQWEAEWRSDNDRQIRVVEKLHHSVCGAQLNPEAVCRHCREEVTLSDVGWNVSPEGVDLQMHQIRASNKRHRKRGQDKVDDDGNLDPGLESLIGDRWTILILIASFFDARRYDVFLEQLSIPSSVLSSRLKFLHGANVLEKKQYQANPPRHDYVLTQKGKSLFPFVMSLRQWVIDYLPENLRIESLVHKHCGHPLKIDVVCGGCGQKPWPEDIVSR